MIAPGGIFDPVASSASLCAENPSVSGLPNPRSAVDDAIRVLLLLARTTALDDQS